MRLKDLVDVLRPWSGVIHPETDVQGLAIDSRQVQPGDLFIALRGQQADGHQFISQAIELGAAAVLAEQEFAAPPDVGRIIVPSSRHALSALANQFYGNPARELDLVGITGTNGKTTVAFLLRDLALAVDRVPGAVGTAGVYAGDELIEGKTGFTTPEAHNLHRLLRDMVTRGTQVVAMEVTSHALDQERVAHCPFRAAIYTNLTHEHLDYHGNMETYFAAKSRLFTNLAPGATAVINVDDPFGPRLAALVPSGVRLLTYSTQVATRSGRTVDLQVENLRGDGGATCFTLITPAGRTPVRLQHLFGEYNVANALAALGAGLGMGWPLAAMVEALSVAQGAPGRFQRVDAGQDFTVVVDYAHTPDGFEKLLSTVQSWRPPSSRIIMVFGSAGHRDRAKRPVMGQIAGDYCDVLVLTEEDPRTESPHQISAEIAAGVRNAACQVYQVEDRVAAIDFAVQIAAPGDIVLVTGKGNETELEVLHPTTFKGDVPAVEEALARRLAAGRGEAETA